MVHSPYKLHVLRRNLLQNFFFISLHILHLTSQLLQLCLWMENGHITNELYIELNAMKQGMPLSLTVLKTRMDQPVQSHPYFKSETLEQEV
jgi:hypothetical protein